MEQLRIIETSLDYIEENLDNELSLEHISNEFNFSKYYYHRLFSAVMGVSLNNYVLERKLNASVPLIKETNQSLTDIGMNLNFQHLQHFPEPLNDSLIFLHLFCAKPPKPSKQPQNLKLCIDH